MQVSSCHNTQYWTLASDLSKTQEESSFKHDAVFIHGQNKRSLAVKQPSEPLFPLFLTQIEHVIKHKIYLSPSLTKHSLTGDNIETKILEHSQIHGLCSSELCLKEMEMWTLLFP